MSATLQAVNESLRQIAVDYLEGNFRDPGQTVTSRVRLAPCLAANPGASQRSR